METAAKRPGLMPPSGPIQSQHLGLWEELCECRRRLLMVRYIANDAGTWDDAERIRRIRELIA